MKEEESAKIQSPQPINQNHDLTEFHSESELLNDWLKNRALKNEGEASRTYVITIGEKVIGYYCLSTASVTHQIATSKVKRNMPDPIPCMLLGRFAVDARWTGKGIGIFLFRDAILRVLQVSQVVGVRAILVHTKSEKAKNFYLKYGFKPSPTEPMTLMITLADIKASLYKDGVN